MYVPAFGQEAIICVVEFDTGVHGPCGPLTVALDANPEPFKVTVVEVELTVCAFTELATNRRTLTINLFILGLLYRSIRTEPFHVESVRCYCVLHNKNGRLPS